MNILYKAPGKQFQMIEKDDKYISMAAKDCFENVKSIEYINVGNSIIMVANQYGLMENQSYNFDISIDNPFMPVQKILGEAAFAKINGYDEYDYILDQLSKTDMEYIQRLVI